MSRILPEGSSEFWFFFGGEASASQLQRVLFFQDVRFFLMFVRPFFFDVLFVGSFSIFRHRTLCPEDKQIKQLLILWYGVAASSFFPIFPIFKFLFDQNFVDFYFFWSFLYFKE